MISLAEARSIIAKAVTPLPPIEVALNLAKGRVLRQEVRATADFPSFDRSAMDGYAVAKDDSSERFKLIGEVRAGSPATIKVQKGECVRVFTGSAIPPGASQVLLQEQVRRSGDWIVPQRRLPVTFIRHRGEDAKTGQALMRPGQRLRAGETALLAQLGMMRPRVSPLVRVAHFVTGDELVDPGDFPKEGQIRDTNSTLIQSLVRECGALCVHQERVTDRVDSLVRAVETCWEKRWDLLLISGGASVGDYDFGKKGLQRLGFETHFAGVSVRPGKPLIFGTRGKKPAFVLPGNPVSHFVVFHVAVRVALERLISLHPVWSLAEAETTGDALAQGDPRETYWPSHAYYEGGHLKVRPLGWKSSGDLGGLTNVNALIQLPPGAPPLVKGKTVRCVLL